MDLHAAIREVREDAADQPPRMRIHGREAAVYDLLLDSGAAFGMQRLGGAPEAFAGIDVVFDETMPLSTVELRTDDGRTLHRLVDIDGRWYSMDPTPQV